MGELYELYPKLPKNIRQVGERDQVVKLYIEDYVNTYLKRLYPAGGQDLRVGLLLGEIRTEEGIPFLFIDGALEMEQVTREGEKVEFTATLRRLIKNRNYVWGVVAQFFNIGAQIAVWSFVIRYAMQQLNFDGVLASLGDSASAEAVVNALRGVEPVAAAFYNGCEWLGLDDLLPRTAEQAAATYYIMSLILFVIMRFVCTACLLYTSDAADD